MCRWYNSVFGQKGCSAYSIFPHRMTSALLVNGFLETDIGCKLCKNQSNALWFWQDLKDFLYNYELSFWNYLMLWKYLWLTLSLNWYEHIDTSCKVTRRLNLLGRIRKCWILTCKRLYVTLIQPLLEYCDIIWSNADRTILDKLLRLHNRGARRTILLKRTREAIWACVNFRAIDLFARTNWRQEQ